ncbi:MULTISPECIES: DUF397 domain-containing protein [unclassified Nonomuraea]|uniref:DUF397 domain-containing protein n=1 Tax=unclassified Nonomuraea TaxID=2593643 RepID=UPI0033F0F0F4
MTVSREPRVAWRKSSHSTNGGDCVEVTSIAHGSDASPGITVLMRDSKDPAGPRLEFTDAGFQTFVQAVKDGEFDGLI